MDEEVKRVLVIGDKAVGKSTLIKFICTGTHEPLVEKTVGMGVHSYMSQDMHEDKFVDFLELGGSCLEDPDIARTYFQTGEFNALLLVADLTNQKSGNILLEALDWFHEV